MAHFNHRLSRKRGSRRFKRKDAGQDQVGAALNCAQQLPSGCTSAPCDTAAQVSSLKRRGFFQIND